MAAVAPLPELVSKWTVTASPPLVDLSPSTETLSEVDEWLTKSSHWLGFTLRFDTLLTAEVVKEGLARTLHHIPALGARVISTHPTDLKNLYQLAILPIHGEDDSDVTAAKQGVILEYYKGTDTASASDLPNDSHTRQVWKDACLDAPGPGYSGEASETDPLMRAKLVVFEQQKVSYLCIGINHGLGDGSSICDMLQIWSHFCTSNGTPMTLPDHLASRRTLGHRVTEPVKPAKDITELYKRMESDIQMQQNPFRLWTLLSRVVPRAIWCMARAEEVELRVSASKLKALKETVMDSDTVDWVSSFEVLCASLLLVEWVTSSDSDPAPPKHHNLHVACDLRGRSKRFPKGYYGNAAFDFCEPMTIDFPRQLNKTNSDGMYSNGDKPVDYKVTHLVALAQEVHTALRNGLAGAETNACKAKDWFEAARHLGLKNKYNIWAPVIMDALKGDGTFVNSWDKRWLECYMGGGDSKTSKATSMVAWFGTIQNLVVEVPRHSATGDSTIYLALPSAHAKRFRSLCEANNAKQGELMLPFDVVR